MIIEIAWGLLVLALLALIGYTHHLGLDIAYERLADQVLRAAAAAAHELRCRAKARRAWRKALGTARTLKRLRFKPLPIPEPQERTRILFHRNENPT